MFRAAVQMKMARFLVSSILFTCVLLRVRGEEELMRDASAPSSSISACEFPAIYNFGDSNSDTGGISAAFYPMGSPCGETYFNRPAGRGCDGRLIIDFIARKLGLQYLSSYLDSMQSNFRHGANFATGGATIRRQNESWFENGVSPFPLEIQIAQYDQFKSRTTVYHQVGKKSHKRDLPRVEDFSKALYTFDIGQNDIAAGFRKLSKEQIPAEIPDIINQLASAVRRLYDQGGRAFWIHNTGPLGCLGKTLHDIRSIPSPIPTGYLDRHGCMKSENDMARLFNRKLKQKVIQLRKELPLSAITYVNVFAAKYKLLNNAKKHGFLDKSQICCGYHEGSDHVWCGNKGKINNGSEIYAGSCEDPSLYISWDGVHYTEAANHWIADQIATGSFSDPPNPITDACHRPQPAD